MVTAAAVQQLVGPLKGAPKQGATAGGIARDALIGAAPPAELADWGYLAVSIFAGLQLFT